MISHSRLTEVLDYDSKSGIFTWKQQCGYAKPGQIAGGGKRKYDRIQIDGVRYYLHRLAWFYVYGIWPKEIDHKDRNGKNNAITNLRIATTSQNNVNKVLGRNTTGFKGVSKRSDKLFYSRIKKDGRGVLLGYFKTPEEAHAVYISEGKRLFGEFFYEGKK